MYGDVARMKRTAYKALNIISDKWKALNTGEPLKNYYCDESCVAEGAVGDAWD